jgi:hypothetical protein
VLHYSSGGALCFLDTILLPLSQNKATTPTEPRDDDDDNNNNNNGLLLTFGIHKTDF